MWDSMTDSLMRSGSVVVLHELLDHSVQVLLAQDQDVIEAFSTNGAEEPLTKGICFRCSVRCSQHLYAATYCHTRVGSPN
jgi:hypothetical protein